MLTLDEVKTYLRVDHDEDDAIIENLMETAQQLCMDVLRTDDEDVLMEDKNAKVAMLYAVAYFYEHREEADFRTLLLDLRALLFGGRKAAF
jgi:uncharacterized phage protein (predicted DNA packaging)